MTASSIAASISFSSCPPARCLIPKGFAPANPSSRKKRGSVLALVHQRALLDPRHHLAQLGADLLDGMFSELGARRLEGRLVDLVLQHPVARELARLNVVEHALHLCLAYLSDDARAGNVLAVFRGVR